MSNITTTNQETVPVENENVEMGIINSSSPLPINTTGSEPSNTPPEAPESPKNVDIPVSLNNANPKNTPVLTENPEVAKPAESGSVEAENQKLETISEPVNTEPVSVPASGEAGTGQIPVNDPFGKSKQKDLWKRFLDKVQIGKRKKLEKIMTLFLKNSKVTNDEVEKFLRVSDKTAERYLNILEKENRIKQVGKTGHAIFYSKI
ncbi:MAG: hypothetical protein WCP17_03750 [bacterium]